ncbi:uncharacterized protein LOC123663261 [Melitaea cinxia]|uniref:uncharacterized protein LOC123663261 n=1 Tax=Melitaea cinxia TaxID=113334 RepID=UPI001E271BDF|nr:uncharacterized protein LOC123663261 [Melitaea cinxia]
MSSESYNGFYKVFTDGSKDSYGGGAAFYDSQINFKAKFQINHDLSIMHIELLAIAEALSYIKSVNGNNFVIFTDAKSALQHLARCTSTFRGIPVAYDIIKLISELNASTKSVYLQWIPSHCGIVENEIVDEFAKQACTEGVVVNTKPFYSECLFISKKRCLELWKEYFDERSTKKGIWYKTIQPEPMSSPWISNSLSRLDIVIALRMRSGHIPLNKFAYLMNKTNTPNCEECDKIEDVYHIVMECIRNEPLRNEIFISHNIIREVGGINCVLAFPLSKEARALYKLVRLGLRVR